MGARQSSPTPRRSPFDGPGGAWRQDRTAKVVHVSGKLREYGEGTRASAVEAADPGHFLCSAELMLVGELVPRLPDTEQLRAGQIYFLLPLPMARCRLSLHDLCTLAVKASSALGPRLPSGS